VVAVVKGLWYNVVVERKHSWQVVERAENHGAVYAIYVNNALAYIGQTNGLCFRLATHAKWIAKRPFYVKASYDDSPESRRAREKRLIARLRPSRNRMGVVSRRLNKPGATINIRLSHDLMEAVRAQAIIEGRTVSNLVVRVIREMA
jgi:predicted DNA binding CopG/RHH family protein